MLGSLVLSEGLKDFLGRRNQCVHYRYGLHERTFCFKRCLVLFETLGKIAAF